MSAKRPLGALGTALRRRLRVAAPLICALALANGPALAHGGGSRGAVSPDAIVIPSLSHGQMRVIADNRTAILDLAERQWPTDPVMRRLQSFVKLQFFACAWGLVPGGVEDEESPFNECSHAYLAATRALLLHLRGMPGDRSAVNALVAKIETEMLENDSSLVLCRYSDETFNTSELIAPRWAALFGRPASLAAFVGLALALAGAGLARRRRPAASATGS